ncbi:nuclear transport factor 2 family protein [Isoptericola sp. NPDC057391]|uniref:nuclear transport factor 2 family protein n=1 Tax=Isoptericola sp. NPDC057391 TaxID=3346117 RepID=UPI00362FC9DC
MTTAAQLLLSLSARIDAQDWDGLSALLAPDFRARYVHTGETFDKAGFVRLNRDYPGSWRFEHEDVVDGGDRGVLRARVSDATGASDEVYHVASFATGGADGLLRELVEVWADQVPEAPARGRS